MGKRHVDYEGLLKVILDNDFLPDAYYDLVAYHPTQVILDNPYYKKLDEATKQNAMHYSKNQETLWEQSPSNNSFLHIRLNKKPDYYSIFRLYMCPRDEYLYQLVNELIVRFGITGESSVFKYSRRDRLDKLVIYPNDKDIFSKLNVLKEIKKAHPEYFTGMKKAMHWLYETDVDGVYLAPEKLILKANGDEYGTYSEAFIDLMSYVKTELLFHFCKKNEKELKQVPYDQLLTMFKWYFKRELGKYGLLYGIKDDKFTQYTNELYPGFRKSVNEYMHLNDEGMLLSKRVENARRKFYEIPYGTNLPYTPSDYNKYKSFTIPEKDVVNFLYPREEPSKPNWHIQK